MSAIKTFEHGGQIRRWIDAYNLNPDEVVDFSANINPLGIPKLVKEQIQAETNALQHYPEPNSRELKQQIGLAHHVSPSQVIVGNGASELIDLIVISTAMRTPGFRALVVNPTFSEYQRAVNACGGIIDGLTYIHVNRHFENVLDHVEQQSPDMIFLCSPNNPTGERLEQANVQQLMKAAESIDATLLLDYSFMPFADPDWRETAGFHRHSDCNHRDIGVDERGNAGEAQSGEKSPKVVFLYSLTKMYGLPGLRIGYAIASARLVDQLECLRNQWSVNHLAQVVAKTCLFQTEFEQRTRAWVQREKQKLTIGFKQLGLVPYESSANFVLVNTENRELSVKALWEALAKKGLFVRNCANFDGLNDNYFRVAVRLPRENDRLLNALEKLVPR